MEWNLMDADCTLFLLLKLFMRQIYYQFSDYYTVWLYTVLSSYKFNDLYMLENNCIGL